jgi:hypothetical protein
MTAPPLCFSAACATYDYQPESHEPPMIAPAILLLQNLVLPAAGPSYWQQHLDYDIQARLDEPLGRLAGTQRVLYRNNSPDTLRTVSFHLYLNAFRPGSRWADADSAEGRRRFNDLKDPDFGYNRVREVTIDGTPVPALYPFAPDSTIVRFTLPTPLPPGGSLTVAMGWEARPSTLPRRQGRRGRHYDFAQWYPRVVAYDKHGWAEHPLYPAGEFYGDFGNFRVTLDVPEDQVVGATGVPVCGDPGWARANQNPARPVELLSNAYGGTTCGAGPSGAGRKVILWEAREVHHFAMSMNPAYRYEGGRYGGVAVHVLYQPGDERTWGGGIAVRNTETALRWLDGLFGPFPWPQITNVHRIEGGGTEFPMMVHDGSAGLGLILHEVGHNYLMGILASNEWREGFLDEGFTSFQSRWYNESVGAPDTYANDARAMLLLDRDGWSQPTSLVSERYRDFATYNAMIYDRGELFFHQLRGIVGDSAMRQILRTYYQRWKLKHVDEAAFRAVAEAVSRRDLSAFFAQWLHTTVLYDYAVGKVTVRRTGGTDGQAGGWTTRVEVVRKAPGVYPIDVVVRSGADSSRVRTDGNAERAWVQLVTRERPREVELDPEVRSHDWNVLNNRKRRGLLGFGSAPRHDVYFDPVFSQRVRRDAGTVGLVPALWYNDVGGVVLGGRMRTDYLGRFQQGTLFLAFNTRGTSNHRERVGGYLRLRNPTALQAPRTTQAFEAYWIEGRAGLMASAERQTNLHRTFGAQTFRGGGVRWLVTTDTDYLDPALWDAGGTVEASTWIRSSEQRGAWMTGGRLSLDGGVEYRNRGDGLTSGSSYDIQPYGRLVGEAQARRSLGARTGLAFRGYAGWVESGRRVLKQRQLFLAGADPYEQFAHPFLRSRGSLLAGEDFHYQLPGGGGHRGLSRGMTATRLVAINAELERSVVTRKQARLFREVRVAAFADAAFGNGDIPPTAGGGSFVAGFGPGIRIAHCIGQTSFTTSLDFPVLVSRPRLALSDGGNAFAFRWVVSTSSAFVTGERPSPGPRQGPVGCR